MSRLSFSEFTKKVKRGEPIAPDTVTYYATSALLWRDFELDNRMGCIDDLITAIQLKKKLGGSATDLVAQAVFDIICRQSGPTVFKRQTRKGTRFFTALNLPYHDISTNNSTFHYRCDPIWCGDSEYYSSTNGKIRAAAFELDKVIVTPSPYNQYENNQKIFAAVRYARLPYINTPVPLPGKTFTAQQLNHAITTITEDYQAIEAAISYYETKRKAELDKDKNGTNTEHKLAMLRKIKSGATLLLNQYITLANTLIASHKHVVLNQEIVPDDTPPTTIAVHPSIMLTLNYTDALEHPAKLHEDLTEIAAYHDLLHTPAITQAKPHAATPSHDDKERLLATSSAAPYDDTPLVLGMSTP